MDMKSRAHATALPHCRRQDASFLPTAGAAIAALAAAAFFGTRAPEKSTRCQSDLAAQAQQQTKLEQIN